MKKSSIGLTKAHRYRRGPLAAEHLSARGEDEYEKSAATQVVYGLTPNSSKRRSNGCLAAKVVPQFCRTNLRDDASRVIAVAGSMRRRGDSDAKLNALLRI